MKRKQLSKSDIKEINKEISKYNIKLNKKDKVEIVDDVYFVNDKPFFFIINGAILPTLKMELENSVLKHVTVDMGAVKFLVNGADVMRPGVVKIQDGIKKDEILSVIDEKNSKALCIGKALFDYDDMKNQQSGKIIKNLHYVGDELWNI